MPDLVRRVRAFVEREQLWHRDTRVVAAVSGGSDSVALTHLVARLSKDGLGHLAGLVHVHHRIRGDAADADAAFVAALGTRLGVAVMMRHADVPTMARHTGCSLEVAGRQVRLACYAEARRAFGAGCVALGHTRGDQVETVLLRLARGTGPRGLAAMAPANGWRVRPLLDIDREELRAWLRGHGEPWCEDLSNSDLQVPRNRVRLEVRPALQAVNPRADEAVARLARLQAADAALLESLAEEAWARVATVHDGAVRLAWTALSALPRALATRVARRALQTVGLRGSEGETVRLLSSTSRLRFNRVSVQRLEPEVVLRKEAPAARPQASAGPPAAVLTVPGTVWCEPAGLRLSADGPYPVSGLGSGGPDLVRLCADVAMRGLQVRHWRPGDRIQPLGLQGHRKLQDVFVDRKVPRDERALVPIVCGHDGAVLWVAGHVLSEQARVTTGSSGMVVLKIWRDVSVWRPL